MSKSIGEALLDAFLTGTLHGNEIQEFERYYLAGAYALRKEIQGLSSFDVFRRIQKDYGLSELDYSTLLAYMEVLKFDEISELLDFVRPFVTIDFQNQAENERISQEMYFACFCNDWYEFNKYDFAEWMERTHGAYLDCVRSCKDFSYPETNFRMIAESWYLDEAQEYMEIASRYLNIEKAVAYNYLLDICSYGLFDVAVRLIEAGADVNCVKKGSTPLLNAVSNGNLELVRYLVDHGAETAPTGTGIVITYAILSDKRDVVQYLLDMGLDALLTDRELGYCLADVHSMGDIQWFDTLMTRFRPYLTQKSFDHMLHRACFIFGGFGFSEGKKSIDYAFEHGASITSVSDKGETVLMEATYCRLFDLAEACILAGVDVNARNQRGMTGLMYLPRIHDDVLQGQFLNLYLSHGVRLNATDNDGKTFLHYLLEYVVQDILGLSEILASGVDVNIQDIHGNTAAHCFCRMNRYAFLNDDRYHDIERENINVVLEELRNSGADFSIKNKAGETPLEVLMPKVSKN
ncbi:MAG: ankyrin repeat domain-containing protein [Sphaerochaetaceae bacterium]